MTNVELVRLAPDSPLDRVIVAVNSLVDSSLGNLGARVLMVGHDGTSTDPNLGTVTGTGLYQTVIRSGGANHLQIRNAADSLDLLTVTDTTTTARALTVTTTSTFTGAATFNGNVTLGDASGDSLTVNATSTFVAAASFNGNVTLGDAAGDTLTVNATGTYVAPQSFNGNVTLGDAAGDTLTVNATGTYVAAQSFNGNVTLGDAAGDALTVNATSTFASPVTFSAAVTGNSTIQFKTPLSAVCSVALSLTTSFVDVTGASLSLSPGAWLVTGVFDMWGNGALDVNALLLGQIVTSGGTAAIALSGALAVLTVGGANTRATVAQTWLVTVTATTTAKLQARKTAGTGASTCETQTTITATNA